MEEFDKRKVAALAALISPETDDKSPKGSLDAPIKELVETMNSTRDFCTTSSCSGRITVFIERGKKGGEWLICSHDPVSYEDLEKAVFGVYCSRDEKELDGKLLVFRFEPLILTVECRTLEAAKQLVKVAIAAGLRCVKSLQYFCYLSL